jgi:hypothetical protein
MDYEAITIEPDAARDSLFRLWSANLPACGDLEEKLRWFYREGPHGSGRAVLLQHSDEAIGCAGIGVRTLKAHGWPLRTALFADLAVDKRHRSGMPALTLLGSVKREISRNYDLGYGFPNAKAVAVYFRAGYKLLGEMRRYVRVLRSEPYLRQRLGSWLAQPASNLVDHSLAALAAVRARIADQQYELRWPRHFDAAFDRLWREASPRYPVTCERSSVFLRWRFLRKPALRPRIAALHSRETGELRAYTVLQAGTDGAVDLLDLFGAGDRELHALLALHVPPVTELGATSIRFRFLYAGDRTLHRLLAQHAFTRRPETRAVMAIGGRTALFRVRDEEAPWYITDLDEDT